jgi:leucyl-tRNA synthetase
VNILPSQLTIEVWDYILIPEKSYPSASTEIPRAILDHLRHEFQYWYPVDLHSSTKDSVTKHFIFSLYNHTAIWPNHPELWPRAFCANSQLRINSSRMSRANNSFMTLAEAIDKFSADG